MSPAGRDTDLAALAGRLGRLLHAAGIAATPERAGRFAAALAVARPARLPELYWLGRVTLLTDYEQVPIWDRVFAQVFGGLVDVAEFRGQARASMPEAIPQQLQPSGGRTPPAERGAGDGGPAATPPMAGAGPADSDDGYRETVMVAISADERLRTQDFATLSADELLRLRALMRGLVLATPPRRSRRHVPGPRGSQVDLRASLRRARGTGGDPVHLQRRAHRNRARRLVLLCDISGSMESYARAYMQLLLSAVDGTRAEAFVFATRLTRVTRALHAANPDLALARAGRAAPDWAGGTRIGEAIKAFNDRYGRRGMARGAVVVILSDGWERGDAALLGQEMGRLQRLAHRVIWVNPRRAADRYRPLAAGMDAALPYVDVFLSGHSLSALDDVLAAIAGDPSHRFPGAGSRTTSL
ncbi:MAG: VWA domain-containing protein [Actinomycetota bacterium]|nr:VWA domain-containing protein [Actinomycetota bacterium]